MQPQSITDDLKWCRIRGSNNLPSSVHVVLPEILDLRYRDILSMFRHSIEQGGVNRIIIDFSKNNKLMESGWVVLLGFIRFLENTGRGYQFTGFNEACSEIYTSLKNYPHPVCVDFAKTHSYALTAQRNKPASKSILN